MARIEAPQRSAFQTGFRPARTQRWWCLGSPLSQVRNRFERIGIQGAEHLQLVHTAALEHVRDLRDTFVDLVLANTTDDMKEHELIESYAEFISPNIIDRMNIKRLGASLDERGVPHHDPETLQVGRLPIYLAGDATGGIANLQRAADQGRIAGYNAAQGFAELFNQKTPMAIIFCEPNIACVGAEWANLDESRTAIAQIRFGPVGRALIMGQNRGILRVYADKPSGRLLGAAMIGPRCEHLAHLIAWAVESRMTAQQALQMPFYHPVIEEALQDALHALLPKIEPRRKPFSLPNLGFLRRQGRTGAKAA